MRAVAPIVAIVAIAALPVAAEGKDAREAHLQSYGGYGTLGGVVVRGRVARGKAPVARAGRGSAGKLWATGKAFLGRDIEHALIRIQDLDGDRHAETRADDEGFFEARLPGPFPPGPRRVAVSLVDRRWRAPRLETRLEIVDGRSGLVVISDIDDTLIATGVTGGKLSMIARVMTSDASDIVVLPGAPEALRAFAGAGVPIVYLSASPIELAPRLMRLLELRGFPPGALFLRYYPEHGTGDPTAYKRGRIDAVLADFPGRDLVLLGDNGEHDREIFAALARETGRVAWAYIRRTVKDTKVMERQLVFDAWPEVIEHARTTGLIR